MKNLIPAVTKNHPALGCCGIDCGLCPRFYTSGPSVCPGCGGPNFNTKHPSCGFLTCCVTKLGLEVCAECKDFPCSRFEPERKGFDSFVTHRKVFANLGFVKSKGMEKFLEQQKVRMTILGDLLCSYDEGRSKSFFCLACALLPLEDLQDVQRFVHGLDGSLSIKEKNKVVKGRLVEVAVSLGIDLKLRNKSHTEV